MDGRGAAAPTRSMRSPSPRRELFSMTDELNRNLKRNPTRVVRIGTIEIGAGRPIAVQSMTATQTTDIEATVAADQRSDRMPGPTSSASPSTARTTPRPWPKSAASTERPTWPSICRRTIASPSRSPRTSTSSATTRATFTTTNGKSRGRIRCGTSLVDRGRATTARSASASIAARSIRPRRSSSTRHDSIGPMLASALEHCELLDSLGFTRYCVSLKDSDPAKVIEVNRRFAEARPDVPLHLGVTEAGMPPDGIIKTRIAFEQLISRGIGDTIRVSLTVPNARKQRRDRRRPADPGRHRRRPRAQRRRFWPARR